MNPINALMGADGQRPQLLKLDFFRPHPIIVIQDGTKNLFWIFLKTI
jgi:hypothetical protein